jgi:hypothetical protein
MNLKILQILNKNSCIFSVKLLNKTLKCLKIIIQVTNLMTVSFSKCLEEMKKTIILMMKITLILQIHKTIYPNIFINLTILFIKILLKILNQSISYLKINISKIWSSNNNRKNN